MSLKKLVALFSIFLSGHHLTAQIDYKGFPQWSWHKEDSTEYYLYTPSNMKPGEKYPIALFMHGCCGESYQASLRNTVDPPLRMWHNFGANTQSIPTYLISPATSRGWQQHFKNLKKVIDDLVDHHNGDPQRIYVTGFSMGGEGVFKIIQQYPDYFAAAIPMGMSFRGDSVKIKDIPIWINQGETDWLSRHLKKTVESVRRLNGDMNDTGAVWVTGVNPRYSNFKGVDHGVQWVAASTQDLTGWAYSKVNDGNKYPIAFFKSPAYRQEIKKGGLVTIDISATDPDGSIAKTEVFINGNLFKILSKQPFIVTFKPGDGDSKIEAVVTDNKGKKTIATTIIKVNEKTKIVTTALPYGRQGAFYDTKIQARGNGNMSGNMNYTISNGDLPKGCKLAHNGFISGIPVEKGTYNFSIIATDEDGDISTQPFTLLVKEKRTGEITVRNAITDSGTVCDISKIRIGETLFTGATDDEISFTLTGSYDGMTVIKMPVADTARHEQSYLSFETDEDAIVFVGYEKKDRLMRSTIPAWLTEFTNQPTPQIVAQYYYYDVYAKEFSKGKIILPGADERKNNASTGYFVMVKKAKTFLNTQPEINTATLADAIAGRIYAGRLTALYGKGSIKWQIKKGALPAGLKLQTDGSITGTPLKKGSYSFMVTATDQNGQQASVGLNIITR
jgi:hypothetical protein